MRASIATHRAHWIAFAAVIGLFLLPIVLNLVLHFPGEFDEYRDYATSYQAGGHGLSAAISLARVPRDERIRVLAARRRAGDGVRLPRAGTRYRSRPRSRAAFRGRAHFVTK
jgi:hypothetical protein